MRADAILVPMLVQTVGAAQVQACSTSGATSKVRLVVGHICATTCGAQDFVA